GFGARQHSDSWARCIEMYRAGGAAAIRPHNTHNGDAEAAWQASVVEGAVPRANESYNRSCGPRATHRIHPSEQWKRAWKEEADRDGGEGHRPGGQGRRPLQEHVCPGAGLLALPATAGTDPGIPQAEVREKARR